MHEQKIIYTNSSQSSQVNMFLIMKLDIVKMLQHNFMNNIGIK